MTSVIRKKEDLPPPTRGYEHLGRYWDNHFGLPASKILPGEFYVSKIDEIIVTVLGSCISACIHDTKKKVGGMNHFMLPEQCAHHSSDWSSGGGLETRYGNWAMEYLVNELIKLGARRENMEVKIFGGGQIIDGMTDIGERNIGFVREFIANEKLKLVAEDVGSTHPRKVVYFPYTGVAKLKKLDRTRDKSLVGMEKEYSKKISTKQEQKNDIELF